MKNKIFNRLKQEYAHLGFDDNFLLALAESLANSGFVTDDNIEGVVAGQKAYLERVQKSNDKRVQEAVDKAKKKAEEASATTIADLQKQLDDAKKSIEQNKPVVDDKEIPDWFKKIQEENEKRETEYREKISALEQANSDAKKEKEEADAKKAAAERLETINKKAKEKGIPDWIIKRGFGTLSADADDAAIDAYLSELAQDIKTNFLPAKGAIPQMNDAVADKSETDAIVAKIFPNNGKKKE